MYHLLVSYRDGIKWTCAASFTTYEEVNSYLRENVGQFFEDDLFKITKEEVINNLKIVTEDNHKILVSY